VDQFKTMVPVPAPAGVAIPGEETEPPRARDELVLGGCPTSCRWSPWTDLAGVTPGHGGVGCPAQALRIWARQGARPEARRRRRETRLRGAVAAEAIIASGFMCEAPGAEQAAAGGPRAAG